MISTGRLSASFSKERSLFPSPFPGRTARLCQFGTSLARRRQVLLEDLEDYPCLSFEQGTYNSFYFSEEILSTIVHRKEIHVSDRATLFNLLIGLNGYTICSGVLSEDLNGSNIISIPLKTKEYMLVGWIDREQSRPSRSALLYIEELKRVITEYGYEVIRTDD
ncbi:substrate-binding domain-containing protein [Akkermansia muciniphila]|nr:substrate-binding domain-containing protein [Akkermansia muciniphila]